MNNLFDKPIPQQFDVFHVTQLAPQSFLEQTVGLDHIYIASNTTSEIHRHNHSDNIIFVLKGRATIILNGEEHAIAEHVRVKVPRGMWHGFRTESEPLEFVSAQMPPILDKSSNNFDREIQPK